MGRFPVPSPRWRAVVRFGHARAGGANASAVWRRNWDRDRCAAERRRTRNGPPAASKPSRPLPRRQRRPEPRRQRAESVRSKTSYWNRVRASLQFCQLSAFQWPAGSETIRTSSLDVRCCWNGGGHRNLPSRSACPRHVRDPPATGDWSRTESPASDRVPGALLVVSPNSSACLALRTVGPGAGGVRETGNRYTPPRCSPSVASMQQSGRSCRELVELRCELSRLLRDSCPSR